MINNKTDVEENSIYLKVHPLNEKNKLSETETSSLKSRVVQALHGIYDPEIPVNIYDLGLIYNVDADEETGNVKIIMTLTSPGCPVAQTFPQTIQDTVLQVSGVSNVVVDLVFEPPWTPELMSEVAKLQLNMF